MLRIAGTDPNNTDALVGLKLIFNILSKASRSNVDTEISIDKSLGSTEKPFSGTSPSTWTVHLSEA